MVEPLTIATSVVGLVASSTKISILLASIITAWKDAPKLVHIALAEVNAISAALGPLQLFLIRMAENPGPRAVFIQIEPLVATLTDAVMAFSDLEDLVAPMAQAAINSGGFGFRARIKVLFKEEAIQKAVQRIQFQKASFSLMLNILHSGSDMEAAQSFRRLEGVIQNLIENSTEIASRMRQLEDSYDARSTITSSRNAGHKDADGASLASIRVDFSALGPEAPNDALRRFGFEEQLLSSRVYNRTQFYPTDRDTLTSAAARTHAWSVFSGLSMADISAISVIALPLRPTEISHAEHYNLSSNPVTVAPPHAWRKREFSNLIRGNHEGRRAFPRWGTTVNPVAASNGDIYMFGGLINDTIMVADLWVVSVEQMTCLPVAMKGILPGPRVGARALVVGNAFCLFGGDTAAREGDEVDNNLYLLNRDSCSWSLVPMPELSRPRPRYGHSFTLLNTKIYVFGGQLGHSFFSDILSFNLTDIYAAVKQQGSLQFKWETYSPPKVPASRTNHSAVEWKNKLYIFGGTDGAVWYNDVWCFDPVTVRWEDLTSSILGSPPTRRESHAAAVVGDMMFVQGGRSQRGSDLSDLFALDLSALEWHLNIPTNLPGYGRSGHSMTTLNHEIVLLGGGPGTINKQSETDAPMEHELTTAYILDARKLKLENAPNKYDEFVFGIKS